MKKTKLIPPIPAEDIRSHINLMLASPDFKATPQQIALLRYVIEQKLDGNESRIKGFNVAVDVFGRGADFEQNTDPIVSIQAARLRQALARYYQADGSDDEIRITIPKGSYVPVFETRPRRHPTETGIDARNAHCSPPSHWPSVLVQPARDLSNDPELNSWGTGVTSEIANELNHYPDIHVMTLGPENPETAVDRPPAQFVLDGSIRSDGTCIKMILRLADTLSGRQVWSSSHRFSVTSVRGISYQEAIAREVAFKVAGNHGGIARTLERASKRGAPRYSPIYEAVLRYYEYERTATPDAFQRTLAALEEAVALDPDCGQVWTLQARLLADSHLLDLPGIDQPLERAQASAQNGLRRLPLDQRAHVTMALIHLLRNDLQAGREEAERALELGPETLFVLNDIGAMLTLLGDWKRGPGLLTRAIRLTPLYGQLVHNALWFNRLRQKNYDRPHHQTRGLRRRAHFWDHLVEAAMLGLRGDLEDGRESAAEMLRLKPDFPERGRMLIGRLVKFEDIREQIIRGLGAVGVAVE